MENASQLACANIWLQVHDGHCLHEFAIYCLALFCFVSYRVETKQVLRHYPAPQGFVIRLGHIALIIVALVLCHWLVVSSYEFRGVAYTAVMLAASYFTIILLRHLAAITEIEQASSEKPLSVGKFGPTLCVYIKINLSRLFKKALRQSWQVYPRLVFAIWCWPSGSAVHRLYFRAGGIANVPNLAPTKGRL